VEEGSVPTDWQWSAVFNSFKGKGDTGLLLIWRD